MPQQPRPHLGPLREPRSGFGFRLVRGPKSEFGLRLVDERTVHVPCPYRKRWNEDADTASFAEGLMATIRSWSRHSFASVAGDETADLVYERLKQRIAASPEEWSLDYVEHHQIMERVA